VVRFCSKSPVGEIEPETFVELLREDAENLLEALGGQGEIVDDNGLPEAVRRLLDIWRAANIHRFDYGSPLAMHLIMHTDKPAEDVIRILIREARSPKNTVSCRQRRQSAERPRGD
jgi:hypothetical protein